MKIRRNEAKSFQQASRKILERTQIAWARHYKITGTKPNPRSSNASSDFCETKVTGLPRTTGCPNYETKVSASSRPPPIQIYKTKVTAAPHVTGRFNCKTKVTTSSQPHPTAFCKTKVTAAPPQRNRQNFKTKVTPPTPSKRAQLTRHSAGPARPLLFPIPNYRVARPASSTAVDSSTSLCSELPCASIVTMAAKSSTSRCHMASGMPNSSQSTPATFFTVRA